MTATLPRTLSRRLFRSSRADRLIEVCADPKSTLAVLDEVAALALEVAAPLTARRPWLEPELRIGDRDPWAVVARDRAGVLSGTVLLVDDLDDLQPSVSLAGTGGGHRGAVLAVDTATAEALGAAVRAEILSRRVLPSLSLGPLPAHDAVIEAFARGLGAQPGGVLGLVHAEPVPTIRMAGVNDVGELLSHGAQRTLRKAANRMSGDGLAATVAFHTEAARVAEWLPDIAAHHRARDHVHGRVSELDDSGRRRLWEHRLLSLADGENLEMATLFLQGELAAYVLGVVDGDVYRLLEGRFVSRWARYSPGRQLEAAVVQRVIDDPRLDRLDWMTAVAPETLLAFNSADAMVSVTLPFPAPRGG